MDVSRAINQINNNVSYKSSYYRIDRQYAGEFDVQTIKNKRVKKIFDEVAIVDYNTDEVIRTLSEQCIRIARNLLFGSTFDE
jgi:hypothetical protein